MMSILLLAPFKLNYNSFISYLWHYVNKIFAFWQIFVYSFYGKQNSYVYFWNGYVRFENSCGKYLNTCVNKQQLWSLCKEEENHERHGGDGKNGGNSDKLGGFDIVAAVFGSEEAKRGSSGECLN